MIASIDYNFTLTINNGVFRNLNNPLNVTRYHSLVVDLDSLPDELEVTAITNENEIMAIRHKKYLIEDEL